LSGRPQNTNRLVEVGNVDVARAVSRQPERVIQGRIDSRSAIAGVAACTVTGNCGDDPVQIDLAYALGEEIGNEEIPGRIKRKVGDEFKRRVDCPSRIFAEARVLCFVKRIQRSRGAGGIGQPVGFGWGGGWTDAPVARQPKSDTTVPL
jgi:hypothetical protein